MSNSFGRAGTTSDTANAERGARITPSEIKELARTIYEAGRGASTNHCPHARSAKKGPKA